ncbi:MAG: heme ABC transporter permease [Rhodospirillaceae bacterium]|nr:heme ABC transporter permease [Rhodospirillaceae bacterium]
MHRFANPGRFMRLAGAVTPWTGAATVLLFAAGLYYGLLASPADYQQGDSVRIMYVHVPAATLGLAVYVFMAAMSFIALVWRHPLADVAARAASPLGAAFTLIALVTGSIWGKPTWGTWWVWDARLTSFLILFFLYLGHMALANAFDEPSRGARAAAILALVGVVNIPIIKFSVDWWNTLHQPSSIGAMETAIDPTMMRPLLLMWGAFLGFFVTLLLVRMKSDLLAARLRAAQLARAA